MNINNSGFINLDTIIKYTNDDRYNKEIALHKNINNLFFNSIFDIKK